MKSSAATIAQEIQAKCQQLGWTFEVRGSILTITKRIQAGSQSDFVTADSEYYWILSLLPSTSAGSIWGTDGGGVGALSAMGKGLFVMNKSGGSVRVLNALKKL